MTTSVMWFRRDLRLRDQPALAAASAAAGTVLPLFVLDDRLLGSAGTVRTHCLLESLAALNRSMDGALVLRHGDPVQVVPEVARQVGAGSVHITAETTPYGRRRDQAVADALATAAEHVELVATGSPYAVTPGRIRNGSGDPYQVFTPFSRAWREHGWRSPADPVTGLRWCRQLESEPWPESPLGEADGVELGGPTGFGEEAAAERYEHFLDELLGDYAERRDRADLDGTSQLSMHLKYGSVHPRTLLAALARRGRGEHTARSVDTFGSELAWREFYADVVWHHPRSAWSDLRPALSSMVYDEPDESFTDWQQGRTGFPMVDAGMRQLRASGWMHNRVRMITASFLAKDLHVWWPHGARHFLDLLRDGDLASNNHGWQWTAGTGTDASPYFRVFNPVTQGLKFDPDGDYVRRWVPELRHLAGKRAHEPWKSEDGYQHGYPERILDHAEERAEALRRYEAARG